MEVFEIVVALLLGGAALAALARRFGAPYPALVALAGAALALVPGAPTLVLDPELALALFRATCERTGARSRAWPSGPSRSLSS
jgi:monovalent cation/hydrogen antiporter